MNSLDSLSSSVIHRKNKYVMLICLQADRNLPEPLLEPGRQNETEAFQTLGKESWVLQAEICQGRVAATAENLSNVRT